MKAVFACSMCGVLMLGSSAAFGGIPIQSLVLDLSTPGGGGQATQVDVAPGGGFPIVVSLTGSNIEGFTSGELKLRVQGASALYDPADYFTLESLTWGGAWGLSDVTVTPFNLNASNGHTSGLIGSRPIGPTAPPVCEFFTATFSIAQDAQPGLYTFNPVFMSFSNSLAQPISAMATNNLLTVNVTPEPTTLGLLLIGLPFLWRGRRAVAR